MHWSDATRALARTGPELGATPKAKGPRRSGTKEVVTRDPYARAVFSRGDMCEYD